VVVVEFNGGYGVGVVVSSLFAASIWYFVSGGFI
jgi:hypothetical protein